MPLPDAQSLLAVLHENDLVPKASPDELRALAARFPAAADLARELVRRGLLTPFQANEIMRGRAARLVLGQYLLLERLGQGGMGEVFKARHRVLDRLAALKIIRPAFLGHPHAVERFQRECRAAGRLSHPNIVTVHDACQAGDVHFLAMEYVEGKDLGRIIKERGPLPVGEACEYARQTALALQHAHERGLVHRDVKPANLMATADGGTVKLLDLGLARLRARMEAAPADAGMTADGVVIGTPDYLAPEQAGGDSASADIRADVYSLGCTLYHLLAGEPPFPGKTLREKISGHLCQDPPPLDRRRPNVPPALSAVVRRMMAKDPADRYQSPAVVAAALHPFCVTTPGAPAPVAAIPLTPAAAMATTLTYVPPPPKRRKLVAWAAAAGMMLLLICACLGLIGSQLLAPKSALGPPRRPDPVAAAYKDKPTKDSGLGPDRADPPVALPPPPKQVAVRGGLTWPPPECVALLGDPGGRHWGELQAVAFRPDGRLVATADHVATRSYIHLWDAASLRERAAWTPAGVFVQDLAFSPSGRLLAAACGDALRLWDAGDDALTKVRTFGQPGVGSATNLSRVLFTTDGQSLLAWGPAGIVRKWRLTDGDPEEDGDPAPAPSFFQAQALAVSADGRTEAYSRPAPGTGKFELCVRPLFAKQPDEKTVELSSAAGMLALSGDGKRLAARVGGLGAGELRVWYLGDGDPQPRKTFDLSKSVQNDYAPSLFFTPDGEQVALACSPHFGAPTLWLFDVNTGKATQLGDLDCAAACLSFSSDGRALAAGGRDHRLRLWEDRGKGLALRPSGPVAAGLVRRLAFRPAGADLAAASRLNEKADGTADLSNLVVWDWTKQKARNAYSASGWFSDCAYSPDGARLFACGAAAGRPGFGAHEGFLRVWQGNSLQEEEAPKLPAEVLGASVESLAFDRDGKTLALLGGADFARKACVCEVQPFRVRGKPFDVGRQIESLALAPDGSRAAALDSLPGGWSAPVVRFWDLRNLDKDMPTGAEPNPPLEGASMQTARRLTFSPDGKKIAAVVKMGPFPDDPRKALLWDIATGKTRAADAAPDKPPPHVEAFAFSPDGRTLATADADGRVMLWSVDTLETTREWQVPGAVTAVAFSPGGEYMACGDGDGTIAVLRLPPAKTDQ